MPKKPTFFLKQSTKTKPQPQKGQAVLEIALLLPLIVICFSWALLLTKVYSQKLWLDHKLYQSLICLAQQRPPAHCKEHLVKNIKWVFWTHHLHRVQLKQTGENKWQGHIIIQNPRGQKKKFQKSIQL